MIRFSRMSLMIVVFSLITFVFTACQFPCDQTLPDNGMINQETNETPEIEIQQVSGEELESWLKKEDQHIVVEFYTPWCGGCRQISPILDRLAKEYSGNVKIVKVHTAEEQETVKKYAIIGSPTLLFFVQGDEVDRLVGPRFETHIRKKFKKLFSDSIQ